MFFRKFKQFILNLMPPQRWKLPVVVLLGIFTGLAIYVFKVSNAISYLNDEPETCVNCHVMNSYYASWAHSSHRTAATCNDCHVPHNNFVNKYFFKAKDGLRHATMFTLRLEPQVIRIEDGGQKVVHKNCLRCHGTLLKVPHLQSLAHSDYYTNRTSRQCWDCHNKTPHGDVAGLSATPNARVPNPESLVPLWLRKITQEKKSK